MSVNTAHANGGVLIHAGETILLFSDNVSMEFSGQDGAIFKGSKLGRIYLTTHRVIFNTKNGKDPMQSFSSPFISMSDVELEQPVFGANYIRGKIRAQPNGNFTGETKFKMSFKSGGCIDFGQALLRAASMAQRNAGGMAPPPYEAPGNGWYAAPPPAYTPYPGTYGWLPQNSSYFGQPPSDGVYMSDLPPPYPGINPQQPNSAPNYPGAQNHGYPGQNPQNPGYPGQNPQNPGYPGQNPSNFGYPSQPQNFGYPSPPQNPGYPSPPQNPGYPAPSQNSGYPAPPQNPGYPAPQNGPGPSYPTLPQQPFGFNQPSAPGQPMTKEQEAANSAYFDPRNNTAYIQQQQQWNVPPPTYDSLNPNDPSNKKTQ